MFFLAQALWTLGGIDPSRAAADGGERFARFRYTAELAATVRDDTNETLWVTSPLLGLDYALRPNFGLGVEWGFVVVDESPRIGKDLWALGSGDPLFKVWMTRQSADARDQLYLYAGTTAPLAWLSYDVERRGLMRSSYAHAAASRGLWDPWLWAPEQLSLAAGGAFTHAFTESMRLRLEAGLGGSRRISQVTRDALDAYAELAPSFVVQTPRASFGVRLQAVFFTSSSAWCQLSAVPFFAMALGPVTGSLRFVYNLNPPLGFFGAGLQIWGAVVSVQGSL